ncbi:haloacid dehalogenase superfamily, subfamily IA, variant 1 with third motif having Dx(3-4)D or Dx(3-4)E [Haladaptatus litoreus]|uniref:Haloacid dehalogenase superfamily, subfamily IA, variant 1 with third motif having Dx(3-4)D or Dx(3-4)E n=1 Tax=Haladaptatus litoreus TaxID=553468 RepID=A0A1N6ZHQ5_9EURY|nr:HAD-IA family hydrolase [Haladaptatus litoreus]SIR26266.1 haloacid dehalogenase superfamily, subfamily IA, variant 1 with third motif having Dx(3-4)D or Dx(3-4)E [Haladaptatus litoreus]
MSYDAVLFDNDGVLVKPPNGTALREAALSAFAEFGVEPDDDHLAAVSRSVTPDDLKRVCDAYDFDPAEFWEARDTAASDAQLRELKAGRTTTYDDVDALESFARPMGIVSSNQHATIEFMLDHFDLGRHFETYYGRPPTLDAFHRKKPEPYFLEQALADLGVDSALFVGDSESDVVAAHNADLDSVFIRRPHRAEYDLSVDPTYEVEGLREIRELLRD